jgi:anti-sigma factor RsiW
MNCETAIATLNAYADGEIGALQNYSMAKHLLDCADCAARGHGILALRTRIRTELTYFSAPPALRARVLATMGAACSSSVPPRTNPPADHWRWITGGALAGCLASVFSWTVGTAILTSYANEDFAVAAVAAHVRATLGDHLIEVASSNQHTVKPWLSARLDYSPPVQDLASEGFALSGGRLDYLERRSIAALVYRYGEHTIDVFVRPRTGRGEALVMRSVRGFNIARASGPSMVWLAVSDAEPIVLSEFVQRLAREDGSQ